MSKNLVTMAIFTTMIVIAWIGFNIYHNFATSTVSGDISIRIIPIENTFKTKTIEDNLKSRKEITIDLSEKIAVATVAPTIVITLPSSPSGLQLTETGTATGGPSF